MRTAMRMFSFVKLPPIDKMRQSRLTAVKVKADQAKPAGKKSVRHALAFVVPRSADWVFAIPW